MNTSGPRRLPLGRLVAEFLVIVIGVLVALGVDQFMAARAEADRAAAYVEQIEVELTALAEDLGAELESFTNARSSYVRLAAGLRPGALAPNDSLAAWFAPASLGPFQPELVTLNTMVASGDLLLIRDETLRTALMRFQAAPDRLASVQEYADQMIFEGMRTISSRADVNVLAARSDHIVGTEGQLAGTLVEPWDWAELSRDVAFRSAIYYLAIGTGNHLEGLTAFAEELATVRQALDDGSSDSR